MNNKQKYLKEWRKRNRQKLKENNKKSKRKRAQEISSLKNFPCEDCRNLYSPWIMEFDHVPERGIKEIAITGMVWHSWERLLNELFKVDLVCANCHKERTYQRRKNEISRRNTNLGRTN